MVINTRVKAAQNLESVNSEKQAQKESRKANQNQSNKQSKNKNKPINRTEIIKAENIPTGARFNLDSAVETVTRTLKL